MEKRFIVSIDKSDMKEIEFDSGWELEPGNKLVYIYDINEVFLPDFTPDWLYDIIKEVKNSSGGYCLEYMESIFEVDDKFYEALISRSDCEVMEEYDINNLDDEDDEDDEDDYEEEDEDEEY